MSELPLEFHINGAFKMRDLAKSTDLALRMLAANLDLPMEDAEAVDFLRIALNTTSEQMREKMYRDRADRIKNRESCEGEE
jgi:hypothetical protein